MAGLAAMPAGAMAQWNCARPGWHDGLPLLGFDWNATAIAFLPSGDVIAGGGFTQAGDVLASGIARWDGSRWHALGNGVTGGSSPSVNAIVVMPDGDVIAGGRFTIAGSQPASNIARWDGNTWSTLGAGVSGAQPRVDALAVTASGHVIAAGTFSTAGSQVVNNIAHWDGSQWTALGEGVSGTDFAGRTVRCLTVMPNGSIIAGGHFTTAGGAPTKAIARFDGTGWTSLGIGVGGFGPTSVHALAFTPTGELVVAGQFEQAGGQPANNLAVWNGLTWSAMAPVMSTSITSVAVLTNGNILVTGGILKEDGAPANGLARWNGRAWDSIGDLSQSADVLVAEPDGEGFIAAGGMIYAGDVGVTGIARWSAASGWTSFGSGTSFAAHDIDVLSDDRMLACGQFMSIEGTQAARIARWENGQWLALGEGLHGSDFSSGGYDQTFVSEVEELSNGDVIALGHFDRAGDVPVNGLARWDGQAWSAFGGVNVRDIITIKALKTGGLAAGGPGLPGQIAVWKSGSWTMLGTGVNGPVTTILETANGDLIVGGGFTQAGGEPAARIARWNGRTWSPLGDGFAGPSGWVSEIVELDNGEIVACGIGLGSAIALWDGSVWSPLGDRFADVSAIERLPNEAGLVAVGDESILSRWDGSRWIDLGSVEYSVNPGITAIGVRSDGEILVSGMFGRAGGQAAGHLARFGCNEVQCDADCDGDATLTIDDFICYQTLFALGFPNADCDADGNLTIDDFICFQTVFALGCQ